MKDGGLISLDDAWRGLPTSDASSSLSRDRANVSVREQILLPVFYFRFTFLWKHRCLSALKRLARRYLALRLAGFVRLVLLKLNLRGGFQSVQQQSVGVAVGGIGSCHVLRGPANVASVANVGRLFLKLPGVSEVTPLTALMIYALLEEKLADGLRGNKADAPSLAPPAASAVLRLAQPLNRAWQGNAAHIGVGRLAFSAWHRRGKKEELAIKFTGRLGQKDERAHVRARLYLPGWTIISLMKNVPVFTAAGVGRRSDEETSTGNVAVVGRGCRGRRRDAPNMHVSMLARA